MAARGRDRVAGFVRAVGAVGDGAAQSTPGAGCGGEGDGFGFIMKLGNRRKKRPEYLLDVKVQTRGRAVRRLRVAMALFLALGMLALTGYGTYRLAKATGKRFV